VAFLSRLRHKHLVDLVGYCAENKERLLVCEYMKNGALYDHLQPKATPSSPSPVMSSWKLRIRILLDASRGIEYLHSYCTRPEAEAVELVAYTAVHCVQLERKDRPAMADIVANLETAFALFEGSFDGDLVKSPSSDSLPVITPIDQD
jgi:hypothetical protein